MTVFIYTVSINANGWFGELPSLKVLENPKSEYSSEMYSSDGELLGKYFLSNRTPVSYEEISKNVKDALLATEDIRFFEHAGIDLKGTIAIPFYLLKGDSRGSSTITQQLSKNLFRTRGAALKGSWSDVSGLGKIIVKVKEWICAVQLERSYTKEEIMTMYLNTVDFGSNSFGIKVAAKTFFGKDQKDLTVDEAAILVGLLKAPTDNGPTRYIREEGKEAKSHRSEMLKNLVQEKYMTQAFADSLETLSIEHCPVPNIKCYRRRSVVFDQLTKYDYLNKKKLDSLNHIFIDLTKVDVENHNKGIATYFRSIASDYLKTWCNENGYDLYRDGLKIYTTIDSRMQTYAEQAMDQHLGSMQKKFFSHWKGRNPWVVADDKIRWKFHEIKNYAEREIKKGERWRLSQISYDGDSAKIWKTLYEPKPMTLFNWDYSVDSINGKVDTTWVQSEIDTVLSPMDSLRYYKHFLHSGLVSMEPQTGEIKAWVGGINHKHFKYDHVKQGKRQPGSTFKPIVYATVVGESDGVYSPCYKVVDAPVTFLVGPDENNLVSWTPQNADGKFSGDTLTLRQAMARSINSITAFMMKIMGEHTPHMVVKYARRLGITSDLEPVPALCLGTFDVSLYEMIGVYGAFVNDGLWIEPHFITRIEDRYGNVIKRFSPKQRNAVNQQTAQIMLHMLRGATQEKGGTATGLYKYGLLNNGNEIAAKTGTTQSYSDGWFMGCVPKLVSGVWVGGDDKSIHFRTMDLGQGARMAMPIWANYMQRVYADTTLNIKKQKFKRPSFDLNVELNCDKYEQPEEQDKNVMTAGHARDIDDNDADDE